MTVAKKIRVRMPQRVPPTAKAAWKVPASVLRGGAVAVGLPVWIDMVRSSRFGEGRDLGSSASPVPQLGEVGEHPVAVRLDPGEKPECSHRLEHRHAAAVDRAGA